LAAAINDVARVTFKARRCEAGYVWYDHRFGGWYISDEINIFMKPEMVISAIHAFLGEGATRLYEEATRRAVGRLAAIVRNERGASEEALHPEDLGLVSQVLATCKKMGEEVVASILIDFGIYVNHANPLARTLSSAA
jgi:hypothetical protein